MQLPLPADAAAARAAARQALDATFRSHAYDRSFKQTLFGRMWAWILEQFEALRGFAARSPALTWSVVALVGALVALVVARAVYLRLRRGDVRRGRNLAPGAGRADDPWRVAAAFAAAGDFTAAAHALYAALLERLARRDRLARHPAKTAGDYARELRMLGSPAYAPFRLFARDYDVVVYGLGVCDGPRYSALLRAADAVLPASPDGRTRGG